MAVEIGENRMQRKQNEENLIKTKVSKNEEISKDEAETFPKTYVFFRAL